MFWKLQMLMKINTFENRGDAIGSNGARPTWNGRGRAASGSNGDAP
jgi:hypothetical protein